MKLRNEQPGDASVLDSLITDAFRGAHHASGNEAAIVAALRADDALTLSIVAEQGRLLGHIAASAVTIGAARDWVCIAPLSVAPDHQRQGIGAALMNAALARLRDQSIGGVVLVGDPAYYRRFGFRAEPRFLADGIPPEYVMALPFDSATPVGQVIFHPAFMG